MTTPPMLFPCTLDTPRNLFYDPERQLLSGIVKGITNDNITGVFLRQDTYLGGLFYSLLGQYDIDGKPGPFETPLETHILLPKQHFNNKTVLISTGSEPEGVEYTILYGGLKTPLSSGPSTSPPPPVGSVLPPIKLTVLDGGPFYIKANADVGQNGTVDINFSSEALKLTAATIAATDIVWTLVAQDGYTGDTLVNVTRNFVPTLNVTPYSVVQPYLVKVIVLEELKK